MPRNATIGDITIREKTLDRVLWLGGQLERTVGHRLRSETIINGRPLKDGHPEFARPGLRTLKEKMAEKPRQEIPDDWPDKTKLPEQFRP